MANKYNDITYIFHSNSEHNNLIRAYIKNKIFSNCEVISDNKIKLHLLKKSIFALVKSGTVSLEVCNAKIPSIILYKMNFINFLIIKMLVKTKYANIINIIANQQLIPELLQSQCNPKNIYKTVCEYLESPLKLEEQTYKTQKILNSLKIDKSAAVLASESLNKQL